MTYQRNDTPEPLGDNFISKVLRVSSGHLPWDGAAEELNTSQMSGCETYHIGPTEDELAFCIYLEEYQWRIPVWEDTIRAAGQVPGWEDLVKLLELAVDQGCDELVLDDGADALPPGMGFNHYEW